MSLNGSFVRLADLCVGRSERPLSGFRNTAVNDRDKAQSGRTTASPQLGWGALGGASIAHKYIILRAIETDVIAHALELDTA